jgi:hypothetical protein
MAGQPNGVGRIAGQAGSQVPTLRPYHRKTTEAGPVSEALSPSSLPNPLPGSSMRISVVGVPITITRHRSARYRHVFLAIAEQPTDHGIVQMPAKQPAVVFAEPADGAGELAAVTHLVAVPEG